MQGESQGAWGDCALPDQPRSSGKLLTQEISVDVHVLIDLPIKEAECCVQDVTRWEKGSTQLLFDKVLSFKKTQQTTFILIPSFISILLHY